MARNVHTPLAGHFSPVFAVVPIGTVIVLPLCNRPGFVLSTRSATDNREITGMTLPLKPFETLDRRSD
jgi:hypothetical protein